MAERSAIRVGTGTSGGPIPIRSDRRDRRSAQSDPAHPQRETKKKAPGDTPGAILLVGGSENPGTWGDTRGRMSVSHGDPCDFPRHGRRNAICQARDVRYTAGGFSNSIRREDRSDPSAMPPAGRQPGQARHPGAGLPVEQQRPHRGIGTRTGSKSRMLTALTSVVPSRQLPYRKAERNETQADSYTASQPPPHTSTSTLTIGQDSQKKRTKERGAGQSQSWKGPALESIDSDRHARGSSRCPGNPVRLHTPSRKHWALQSTILSTRKSSVRGLSRRRRANRHWLAS